MASEIALMKKGRTVILTPLAFNYWRSLSSSVASISSEKVKKGMLSDSVIVLVIAFLMPVSFLTLTRAN